MRCLKMGINKRVDFAKGTGEPPGGSVFFVCVFLAYKPLGGGGGEGKGGLDRTKEVL